MQAASLISLS